MLFLSSDTWSRWPRSTYSALRHGQPLLPPKTLSHQAYTSKYLCSFSSKQYYYINSITTLLQLLHPELCPGQGWGQLKKNPIQFQLNSGIGVEIGSERFGTKRIELQLNEKE